MPSLGKFSSQDTLRTFARQIASAVTTSEVEPVDVNGGIKTTEELAERLRAGRSKSFDCGRLIDESKTYK